MTAVLASFSPVLRDACSCGLCPMNEQVKACPFKFKVQTKRVLTNLAKRPIGEMALVPFSAALVPFTRISSGPPSWRWGNLNQFRAPPRLGIGTRSPSFANSSWARRGRGCRFIASGGPVGSTNGAAETSQSQTPPQRIYTWPHKKKPRICILGGGFGGLYTALRLESLVWVDEKKPQVLLVDQSEHFVFKPMLYEILSGGSDFGVKSLAEVDAWEIAPRFRDLLANTGVQFFQDRAKVLYPFDPMGMNGSKASCCGGTVLLESGLLIEYDWLVLALGAAAKLDVVPGAMEYAFPFSTLEDAVKVNNKLRALERRNFGKESQIRVAVVGCGYSGVELAATVSERLQHRGIVHAINVEKTICPTAPPGNREAALKVLSSRKVQLMLGYFVRRIQKVDDSQATGMLTEAGAFQDIAAKPCHEKYILELQPAERGLQSEILEADLVLWTVGSKPLLPALEPCDNFHDLPLNSRGQAETDETLRVKGHPRIFALGDASTLRDPNGRILPATAQVAFQQADFTGWNLWAAINDRPLLPFRFQDLGEMMTLGRSDAALSPSFIEGLTLEGPVGHAVRKLVYLIRLPTDEHRLKVGISWLTKSVTDSVASIQGNLIKILS